MKTLFTFALVLAPTVGAIFSASAEENPCATKVVRTFSSNAYISTTHPDRLNVIVVKQDAEPVLVRLLDEDRTLVYTTHNKISALQPLNIKNLVPGTYTVEIARDGQINQTQISVK
jgi:hypothetical protein